MHLPAQESRQHACACLRPTWLAGDFHFRQGSPSKASKPSIDFQKPNTKNWKQVKTDSEIAQKPVPWIMVSVPQLLSQSSPALLGPLHGKQRSKGKPAQNASVKAYRHPNPQQFLVLTVNLNPISLNPKALNHTIRSLKPLFASRPPEGVALNPHSET